MHHKQTCTLWHLQLSQCHHMERVLILVILTVHKVAQCPWQRQYLGNIAHAYKGYLSYYDITLTPITNNPLDLTGCFYYKSKTGFWKVQQIKKYSRWCICKNSYKWVHDSQLQRISSAPFWITQTFSILGNISTERYQHQRHEKSWNMWKAYGHGTHTTSMGIHK